MALIKVLGWLKSPTGQPAINIPIKVTASDSETVLAELFSDIKTDENGYYEFGLDAGRYLIEVLVSQTYHLSGNVTVDENTPTEITITNLVNYSPLVDIPVNKTPVVDWSDALQDHQTQPDLVYKEHRDQVVDGSTVVAEVLSTSTSGMNSTGEAMTHNVTESGNVRVESSETVFEDSSTSNGFARKSDVVSTDNINHTAKVEIYEDTTTEILLENEVTFNDLNSTENTHLTSQDDNHTLDRERSLTLTDGSVTENQSIDFNSVTKEGTAENARTINLDTNLHTASVEHVESIEQTYRDQDSIEVNAPRTTEEDTLRVDGGLHSIEVKETKTGLITKDDEPIGSVIRELLVNGITSIERMVNTGLITLKSYLVDDFKVVDRSGDSVFHVDTVNKEVVLNARLTITNPEDFKGDSGDTIFEVYEYSTNTIDWHTVYVAGDLYRRFNTSVNGYVDPLNWSDPIKMFAEDGLQGDTLYIQFQYSTDQSNWHDVFVDGDIWRRERTITNDSPSTTWTDPARISGADGIPGDTVTIEYEYSVDGLEPWHPNFSTGDHFRRERLVTNGVAGAWSAAAKLVPVKGDDYFDGTPGIAGEDGNHGSGSYIIHLSSEAAIPSSTSGKDAHIASLAGRPAQSGDMLTYNGDGSVSEANQFSHQYLRGSSSWSEFTFRVDGSAVINGTLAAETLKSGTSITDILYITNASSKAELTLSGSGKWVSSGGTSYTSNYRLWVGNTNPASAPYRVDKSGNVYMSKLTAVNAAINGHIEAQSLEFVSASAIPAEIDNKNSDTKGSAGTAESNANSYTENRIYPDQGSIQISGNYVPDVSGWAIDAYGNAEFNNVVVRGTGYFDGGHFNGTVYAKHMVGDLTSSDTIAISTSITEGTPVNKWQDIASFSVGISESGLSRTLYILGAHYTFDEGDISPAGGEFRVLVNGSAILSAALSSGSGNIGAHGKEIGTGAATITVQARRTGNADGDFGIRFPSQTVVCLSSVKGGEFL